MIRILITSTGSLSAMSLAMCLGPVRREVRIIGTNSRAGAAGNFLADRSVLVPPTAEASAWLAALRHLIEEERPQLVLAGRDEELPLLGRLRDECAGSGTHFLVPPASLAPVFNDKYETARFAARHGLPFAETAWSAGEAEALLARHGLPLVAKPRFCGYGSRNAFLLCSADDVGSALSAGVYVIQELLPCRRLATSVEAWDSRPGVPWSWSIQSHDHETDLLLDDGIVASCLSAGLADGAFNRDLRIVDLPAMRHTADAYAQALARLGHIGPVNLQGRLLADGRFVPFEMNARFTGTAAGKAALGYNLVLAALHHWCGVPGDLPHMAPSGKSVQRAPLFLAFEDAAAEALARSGEWPEPTVG